jgi:uncharacterized SAM-binding protein YcdF (DUF218 family)
VLLIIRVPVKRAARCASRNRQRCILANAKHASADYLENYTLPQTKLILKLLLLLFVALFVIWRGRRRTVLVGGFVFFWALTAGWFSAPLLYLTQLGYERPVEPTFGSRTTLILLGGGTEFNPARKLVPKGDSSISIDTTAMLYHECQRAGDVCHVIVSGGNPQRHPMTEADNYAPYLLARGVDASDLTLENQSRDTYENARNVAKILQPEPASSLVVITPSYHMRRSILAFQAFNLDPQPYPSNTREPHTGLYPHFEAFIDANTSLHELIGTARFYVYRLLRLY